MATTVATNDTIASQDPAVDPAFVADRQAFWGSFTRFVTMGTVAIIVLLILMAYFLT